MQSAKIGNIEVEEKVVGLLQNAGYPVSIGWVAYNLKVCWTTASRILMDMSLQGKLSVLRTSKGMLFQAKKQKAKAS